MALPFPIAPTQTDAKSPIDQQLMDAIRLDLDFLDTQIGAGGGGGGGNNFRVNGAAWQLRPLLSLGYGKKLDGAIVTAATTFSRCRLSLIKGGTSGALEVDVKRHIPVDHAITKITAQYSGATQSIGRLGSPISTQSVSIATPIISTQQITKPKTQLNISSIVNVGGNNWLYTFVGSSPLDSDYEPGDYITFAGCSDANNNGEKQIVQVNHDGLPSVLINNASGVEQITVTGTADLSYYSYEFVATVDNDFVVGEEVIFSGHSTGGNNGTKTIFKVNDGANNIICKFAGGATQGGVAGTAQCTRWVYTFAAPVVDTQYIVGEKAEFNSHSSGSNNGKFIIRRVNEAGDNIYVTNNSGVTQGGAAGNANTLRWLYSCATDASADILVGDFVEFAGHSSANNDGLFEVKFINRFAVNNLEIYNENGLTQGGIAGTHSTALKIVWFKVDYAAFYVANTSLVLLEGLKSQSDNISSEFNVVEINRGGFSNYNIVIDAAYLDLQEGAAGRVALEARSIFTTRPRIEIPQGGIVRNFRFDDSAVFAGGSVAADSLLAMDIIELPEGFPENILLSIS